MLCSHGWLLQVALPFAGAGFCSSGLQQFPLDNPEQWRAIRSQGTYSEYTLLNTTKRTMQKCTWMLFFWWSVQRRDKLLNIRCTSTNNFIRRMKKKTKIPSRNISAIVKLITGNSDWTFSKAFRCLWLCIQSIFWYPGRSYLSGEGKCSIVREEYKHTVLLELTNISVR